MQPAERLPVGLAAVGEEEISEQALEIVAVVVSHVPEHGLEIPRSGRLVDRIDDLFETIGDDLVDRAPFLREIDHLVRPFEIVGAVLLADKIVHIHQKFGCGAGAAEHTRHDKNHIHEAAAE